MQTMVVRGSAQLQNYSGMRLGYCMATTLSEIKMNFRVANAMADCLQDMSRKLSGLANGQYHGTLRSASNNWKDENAETYLRKGERVKDKMSNAAKDLNETANTIRTIARNIYNAEIRAWEIAQIRNNS